MLINQLFIFFKLLDLHFTTINSKIYAQLRRTNTFYPVFALRKLPSKTDHSLHTIHLFSFFRY